MVVVTQFRYGFIFFCCIFFRPLSIKGGGKRSPTLIFITFSTSLFPLFFLWWGGKKGTLRFCTSKSIYGFIFFRNVLIFVSYFLPASLPFFLCGRGMRVPSNVCAPLDFVPTSKRKDRSGKITWLVTLCVRTNFPFKPLAKRHVKNS